MTISLMPELHAALVDYASAYKETYGKEETVGDLVPAMLEAFLASDRVFARGRSK